MIFKMFAIACTMQRCRETGIPMENFDDSELQEHNTDVGEVERHWRFFERGTRQFSLPFYYCVNKNIRHIRFFSCYHLAMDWLIFTLSFTNNDLQLACSKPFKT